MPANGIARISFNTKTPTVVRVKYNPVTFLAELTLAGDLEVNMNLRAEELRNLISDASKALGAMVDDPAAIGYDAVTKSHVAAISRLEHAVNWESPQ